MGTPRIRSLSARIQHIAAFEQLPAAQRNADLRALVLEALALLRETVDVARLDHSFSAERATDFNALSTAVDLLATATQGQVVELAFGTVDTGEIAADLRSFVGSLQDNATQLDPVELGLRIELGLRSMYSRLLGAAVHLGASLDDLRSLVRTKVSLLTQEQVNQVWGQIRAEFRPVEHDNNFSIQHGVVDDAFFAAQPEQYRDRIAEYVVEHRPRLELVHAQRNLGSMPMNVVSLARVLTWTQTADATPLDQRQRGILVSISRLATYWRDLFGPETVELARALDIGEDGVLSESSVQETRRQLDLDNRAAADPINPLPITNTSNIVCSFFCHRGHRGKRENLRHDQKFNAKGQSGKG